MTTDDREYLRDVATRLVGYSQFKETRTGGKRELFKLLQNVSVTASFIFPSRAKPCLSIPADFWLKTGSGDFRGALTSSSRRGKYGQFLIKPAEFIDQYAEWFRSNHLAGEMNEEMKSNAAVELASAIANVNTNS